MSLPGPLPYEAKRFGAEREAPTGRVMRPYADRMADASDLVESLKVTRGSLADWSPTMASLLMVAGAVAPVVLAVPGFGSLFADLLVASYPLSAGLVGATVWLLQGWVGALFLLVTAAGGLMVAGGPGLGRPHGGDGPALVRLVGSGVFVLGAALVMVGAGLAGGLAGSAGAAWVLVTGAAGIYGAWLSARRENWLGAIVGALALMAGGRFFFGAIALLALVAADKAFPGQRVARHPWKRSEVALEPIAALPAVEAAPDDGAHMWRRVPPGWAPTVGTIALVFGALAPVVLAIPGFGVAMFGALLFALWPFTAFTIYGAGAVTLALDDLAAGGAAAPGALLVLLWLVVLPLAGGLVAARALSGRRRRWAAVWGALLLAVGGRPLFAVAALACIAWAWGDFDGPGEAQPAPEAPTAPAAH